MKKTLFATGLFLVACTSTFAAKGEFTLTGKLDSLPDNTKMVLLDYFSATPSKPVAEAVATNGQFTLTGKITEPRLYSVGIANVGGGYSIVIGEENAVLTGTARISSRGYFSIANPSVEGSELQKKFLSNMAVREELNVLYEKNMKLAKPVLDMLREASQNKDTAFVKAIYKSVSYQQMAGREKEFFTQVEAKYQDVVLQNKDSWWGPLMTLALMNQVTEDQMPWYNQFSAEAKNSYYGKIVKKNLFPETFVGKNAPVFSVTDANGQSISFKSLIKGKKYILLDFWASWCGPCRKEIPNLKTQYGKYAAKGLEIVSVSVDKNASDWQKALTEEKLPWPNYRDQSGIADLFSVKAIPAVFLIDGKGKIIGENMRGEVLVKKLAELLP